MRFGNNALLLHFLALVAVKTSFMVVAVDDPDPSPLFFCTMGGGFRVLPFLMGYVNAMAQVGLFNETSSRFTTMASSSSGAWFTSQFMFSEVFYNSTVLSTPDELKLFMEMWLDGYASLTNPIADLMERGDDSLVKSILELHGVSFNLIVENVLDSASRMYGDPGFKDRLANSENASYQLRNTTSGKSKYSEN